MVVGFILFYLSVGGEFMKEKEGINLEIDDVCLSPKDWDMKSMVGSLLDWQFSQK